MRALLAVLVLALGIADARGQEFDLPTGFAVTQEPVAREGMTYLFTVQPSDGTFAGLSAIRLSRIDAPVEDADEWLRGRLTADVGKDDPTADLFTDPDSPFADPAFDSLRRALPELFAEVKALAALPLEFCDGPQTGFNATGGFRELSCAFNLGPVRQFLVLRLQTAGDATYFTEIRTMNERRLRHLLTVADTFTAGAI
jgi:hypothetical protein